MVRSCKEIISAIEIKYPTSLGEDYDNVGLIIGDEQKNINKILVCLDITSTIIDEAINNQVDMIISHHPLIFKSMKKLVYSNPTSSLVARIIKADICIYSLHTNFDNAEYGMSDILSELLSLKNVDKLRNGTGRCGILYKEMTLSELCFYIKEKLKINSLKAAGNLNSVVKKVAIVGGAGSDFIDDAIALDCDVLITGDVKHHSALDALSLGINIIDAGHFFTEVVALPYFANFLKTLTDVNTIITNINTNPFTDV